MSVELVDDNGPLTTASRVYGRISPAGQPKSFSPNLIWDFIRTSADVRYALAADLSSLDDYVEAFTLQKGASDNTIWEGQGLRATGFADGVADDDLATVGQITALSNLTIGSTAISGGVDGRVLYDNNGTLGEYQLSGTGKVLMDTNPVVAAALTVGTQQATQGSIVFANTAAGAFPVTLQSSNSTSAAWTLTLPTTAGSSGQALTTNGSGVTTWTTIVTSPAGSNTQVQFNSSGSFGASANLTWSSPTLTIGVAASVTGALALANATSGSAILTSDAANTLALRNSTSVQTYNVYGTYTDSSNYTRLSIGGRAGASTRFDVYTENSGTGGAASLYLGTKGSASLFLFTADAERWQVQNTGHFIAGLDNTYDIGASGATRPRTGYFGTSVVSPIHTLTQGTITADAPQLNGTVTWNNAGVTFTAWKLNVTSTASAAASLLMDLQVGGTTQIGVSKAGSQLFGAQSSNGGIAISTTATSNSYVECIGGTLFVVSSGNISNAINRSGVHGFRTTSAGQLAFCSSATDTGTPDTILARDAANTLALRNSTNAQTFNVYNTYTDASNYEVFNINWFSNELFLQTWKAGTGVGRRLRLGGSSDITVATGSSLTQRWTFENAGHLTAFVDNTYDIGASGANRPRTGYFGTSVVSPKYLGTATDYLDYGVTTSGVWSFRYGSGFTFQLDGTSGIFRWGVGSSFPALKRSSATLQTRLADDSDYAQHAAAYWYTAKGYTVAGLPAGSVGFVARVTDASAPAVGSTVSGGGAAAALVWYNGSNWVVIGV